MTKIGRKILWPLHAKGTKQKICLCFVLLILFSVIAYVLEQSSTKFWTFISVLCYCSTGKKLGEVRARVQPPKTTLPTTNSHHCPLVPTSSHCCQWSNDTKKKQSYKILWIFALKQKQWHKREAKLILWLAHKEAGEVWKWDTLISCVHVFSSFPFILIFILIDKSCVN